jgi:hypothetical protein
MAAKIAVRNYFTQRRKKEKKQNKMPVILYFLLLTASLNTLLSLREKSRRVKLLCCPGHEKHGP